MCIRDSIQDVGLYPNIGVAGGNDNLLSCLLYTSDAADDTPCVDLGGRRIIKKNCCFIYFKIIVYIIFMSFV